MTFWAWSWVADAILYDGEATVVRPGSDVGGAWRDSSRTQLNHVEGEVRPLAPFVKAEVEERKERI